jgi:hypothetical protein
MTNIIKIKERDCVMFSVYGLMFNGGLGNLGRIGSLGQTPNTPTRQIGPKGLQGLIGQKSPKGIVIGSNWERSSEKNMIFCTFFSLRR